MRPKPQEEINKIVELYDTGLSAYSVGQMVGLCHSTVDKHLRRKGLMRPKSEAAKEAYKTREHHWNWRGGKCKTNRGYVYVLLPNEKKRLSSTALLGRYILEHIYVWEKVHGKQLPIGMVIHHLNGIKDDNRIENLIALKRGEHHKLAEPYKKRIKELEEEIRELKKSKELP
jgi:IS30 family transposase